MTVFFWVQTSHCVPMCGRDKDTSPICVAPPSWPEHLPKAPPAEPLTLGVGFQPVAGAHIRTTEVPSLCTSPRPQGPQSAVSVGPPAQVCSKGVPISPPPEGACSAQPDQQHLWRSCRHISRIVSRTPQTPHLAPTAFSLWSVLPPPGALKQTPEIIFFTCKFFSIYL